MPRSSAKQAPDRRDDRLVNSKTVREILDGIHRATLNRRRKRDPRFPKPVGVRLCAHEWWESDIYAYLDLIQREPTETAHNHHMTK